MTLGQHIKELAKSSTIDDLWAAFDGERHPVRRANLMGAILAKLRTDDWRIALASRN